MNIDGNMKMLFPNRYAGSDVVNKVEGFIARVKEAGLIEDGHITDDGEIVFEFNGDIARVMRSV